MKNDKITFKIIEQNKPMNKSAQIVHIHKADKAGVTGSIVRN